MRLRVAVLFGGKSVENEISVLTGVFVMNVMDKEKYQIIPLYVHTDGGMYSASEMTDLRVFKKKDVAAFKRVFLDGGILYMWNSTRKKVKAVGKVDVILNCCHGGLAEGGGVAALAEWNGIACASPDLTASGVFMDKCTTKLFMRALGVPTVDYIRVNERDYQKRGAFLLKSIEGRLKYPVVVKPAHLGSSIGIAVARNEQEAKAAIESVFALDDRAIVEKYLADKLDVNCAACMIKGEICVSEPEIAFGSGVYSFEEKYVKRTSDGMAGKMTENEQKDGGRYAIKGELRDKIRSYTKTIYKRMNLLGVVRMDFLVHNAQAYLCEVNTVPGSLAYYLFCERVSDARTFFGDLVDEAIVQKSEEKKLPMTGILDGVSRK